MKATHPLAFMERRILSMRKTIMRLAAIVLAALLLVGSTAVSADEPQSEPGPPGWFSVGSYSNMLHGFRDRAGVEVIPPTYDSLRTFSDGYARVRLDGKYGFVNPWGRVTIPPEYDETYLYSDGLSMVGVGKDYQTMKWGIISVESGRLIVPVEYSFNDMEIIERMLKLPPGTVIPEKVERLHWDEVKRIFPVRTPVQVFDVFSGITYNVASLSNGTHADVEPVTARDTALLYEAFGGEVSWYGLPIWVTIRGRTIAATIHSVPHDVSTIPDNNMNGHVCMHFHGSYTSNAGVHSYNQAMADMAYDAFNLYNKVITSSGWPPPPPAAATATPTNASLVVNGEKIEVTAYTIGGSNYFRLRDIAYALNGTSVQFGLEWDGENNAVFIKSRTPYPSGGGVMSNVSDSPVRAMPTSSTVLVDYREIFPRAYIINGSNFFMLRDIGTSLGFDVNWDSATRTISIVTPGGI